MSAFLVKPPIIKIDRTRMVARQECPRLRFLNFHWGGTGLSKQAGSLALTNGIAMHEGFAQLLTGADIDAVVTQVLEAWVDEADKLDVPQGEDKAFRINEQSFLIEGLLRAWHKIRMPQILEDYEPVLVEREFEWPLTPTIHVMLRYDVVLRRKSDGVLSIRDFKTASYINEGWAKRFEHSAQTYLYPLALSEHMNQYVEGIGYEGILKGPLRKDTAMKSPFFGMRTQQSPFCYGYALLGPDGKVIDAQSGYTAKKGYSKIAVWQHYTAKRWFEDVLCREEENGEGTLSNLFAAVPTIAHSPQRLARWRRQVAHQEQLVADGLERLRQEGGEDEERFLELLDQLFPQHDERCFKYGAEHVCPFYDLCFSEFVEEAPLENGYVKRTPHHNNEFEEAA